MIPWQQWGGGISYIDDSSSNGKNGISGSYNCGDGAMVALVAAAVLKRPYIIAPYKNSFFF